MKVSIFLFPIGLFLAFLYLKIAHPATYLVLIQEDSILEIGQAALYFLAFALSFWLAIKLFKSKSTFLGVLQIVFALLFLLVFGEEISWGQRIFHLANGEYFRQHNVQNEISLHNLSTIQPLVHKIYLLIGAYGTLAWLLFFKSKPFFRFVVPEWFLSSYFFFVLLIYGWFAFVTKPYPGSFLLWRDQELAEFLLALGFVGLMVTNATKRRAECSIGAAEPDAL